MHALLITFHVLTCLALIGIVLLQHGKGADIGVQFGASQTVFGARGAGNFLTKLTTGAAIVFMGTSLVLSKLSGRSDVSDILDVPAAERKAEPEVPASSVQPEPLTDESKGKSEGGVPGFEEIPAPTEGAAPFPAAPPTPSPAPAASPEAAPPAPTPAPSDG
jgi:preprotein translocase subunit SecG